MHYCFRIRKKPTTNTLFSSYQPFLSPRSMFTRNTLLAALMAVATTGAFAQTQTLDGISRVGRSAISPIYEGREVRGYVMYSRVDKADKKNDNYLLNFYDQDLAPVSNITIQKPSGKYYLIRNAFNGSAFGFYYYNRKENTLEIETYDTSLKKLGSKVIEDLSQGDKYGIQQIMRLPDTGENNPMGLSLFAVNGKGFLRNAQEGLGKGFALEMYDNDLKLKWRYTTGTKSDKLQTAVIQEVGEKYILVNVLRRDNMMSRKFESFMVAYDVETGKKVLDVPVETGKTEQLSLNSLSYDEQAGEFVAVGEFYKLNDKPMVSKSQGFYIKRFSTAGKQSFSKQYGWQNQVAKALPAEAKESVEDGFVNFTQSIVKGNDGRVYIIAEQFKIVGDGLGIAATALGARNAAMAKGVIGNMLVFVLDPQYNIADIKFYAKDRSNATVPNGGSFLGAGLLGMIFRAQGDFDYQFMQRSNDGSAYNVVYVNYDKEKGEDTKKIVGNIAFRNGQFSLDKIDGTSKATASFVYPAKAGYVMMADHTRKDKKLGLRLVKLNI
jgi:hypothetical protein